MISVRPKTVFNFFFFFFSSRRRHTRLQGDWSSDVCSSDLGERQHLLGRHRVGAGLAGIAPEGAIATVVAAEGRQRHEDLGREGDDASPAAVAHLARAREELVEPRVGGLDQRARLCVRDHARTRLSFGRTSSAKRAMLARTALRSGTVGSKTKCVTPSAAYCWRSAATSAAVPWSRGRSPLAALVPRGRTSIGARNVSVNAFGSRPARWAHAWICLTFCAYSSGSSIAGGRRPIRCQASPRVPARLSAASV